MHIRYYFSQPILQVIFVVCVLAVLVVLGLIVRPTLVAILATPTPTSTVTLAPTPTSTPAPPSPPPGPTFTPTATASVPAETPAATQVPSPTTAPTSSPTPASTAIPTLAPSQTPMPTPTPTPSATPTSTATSAPPSEPSGLLAVPLMYGNVPKVYVVNMAGTPIRVPHAARQPNFSPDGTRLIVNGDYGDLKRLRIEDLRDGSVEEIGDDRLTEHGHPFWSPDGTQLVYDDDAIDPVGSRMFIRDLDSNWSGSGPGSQLTAGLGRGQIVGRDPLWASQDRFIFQGCNTWTPGQEGECGLWSMQGNGGSPERLTYNPRHIPTDVHENVVVYVSDEAGDWNVYRLDIPSGRTRRLTEDKAQDGLATISPDGRWVAFLSERGGRLAVWYVDIDGGTPEWLFDINTSEWGDLRTDGWSEERMSWGSGP